jgi:hypothetical protein
VEFAVQHILELPTHLPRPGEIALYLSDEGPNAQWITGLVLSLPQEPITRDDPFLEHFDNPASAKIGVQVQRFTDPNVLSDDQSQDSQYVQLASIRPFVFY